MKKEKHGLLGTTTVLESNFDKKRFSDPVFVRSQVFEFAKSMEKELQENDYKGGWENCDKEFLTVKLMEEIHELLIAIMIGESDDSVISEAADVANIAMMIADNYKHGRFKL